MPSHTIRDLKEHLETHRPPEDGQGLLIFHARQHGWLLEPTTVYVVSDGRPKSISTAEGYLAHRGSRTVVITEQDLAEFGTDPDAWIDPGNRLNAAEHELETKPF
jgi:hypothetical protein